MRFNQLPKDKIKNFIRNITDKENIQLSDHDIKTIQQIYNSDIRSIINFVQLNQNIKTGDWKGKIINIETLNKIHEMLIDIKVDSAEIVNFIHDKSIQYNIDKRTIILTYFNMVIRDKPVCLKKSFFYNVSEILHNGELQSMDMLNYFCHRFKTVYD
jgi:DNA polymerase III delta prime subunit